MVVHIVALPESFYARIPYYIYTKGTCSNNVDNRCYINNFYQNWKAVHWILRLILAVPYYFIVGIDLVSYGCKNAFLCNQL